MWLVGDREYVTVADIVERLSPDVTRSTVANWCRSWNGHPPRLHPLRGPDGDPVRIRRGHVFAWDDVLDAEAATRASADGRPRSAPIAG